MNNKYLVIGRDEDEPFFHCVSKEDFEIDLWKESYNNHKFLDKLPDIMEFPRNSVFIMYGAIVNK